MFIHFIHFDCPRLLDLTKKETYYIITLNWKKPADVMKWTIKRTVVVEHKYLQ